MKDRNGNIVHDGELITIIDRPDMILHEYWTIFDFIEATKDFVLRNATTNEITIVAQKNIERTY
jgi:hypothetical protein